MFDKEKAQERLSKLSGGVAVFKVESICLNNVLKKFVCFSHRDGLVLNKRPCGHSQMTENEFNLWWLNPLSFLSTQML